MRVYPRRCGGTDRRGDERKRNAGLSPQVRGNHNGDCRCPHMIGSIPAGAGEPGNHFGYSCNPRVYPRRCGGTFRVSARIILAEGLSPQVRGNPCNSDICFWMAGSIPAGAGEPNPAGPLSGPKGVYPRRCGGTGQQTGNGGK